MVAMSLEAKLNFTIETQLSNKHMHRLKESKAPDRLKRNQRWRNKMGRPIEKKKHQPSTGVVVLGFVFAGGCGTNNARRFMASIAPENFPYLFVLVVNTDGPQLKQFFDPSAANSDLDDTERANLGKWIASLESTRQLTIFELGDSGSGAGGDPEVGRKAD